MGGKLLQPIDLDEKPAPRPPEPWYVVAVALGAPNGPACLAVVERTPPRPAPPPEGGGGQDHPRPSAAPPWQPPGQVPPRAGLRDAPPGPRAATTAPEPPPEDWLPSRLRVLRLKRWPAGTRYDEMAADTGRLLWKHATPGLRLLVDTGLGDWVFGLFCRERACAYCSGVFVVSEPGPELEPVDGSHWVRVGAPELAGTILGLTSCRRLTIARLQREDDPGEDPREALIAGLEAFGGRAAELAQAQTQAVASSFGRQPGEELVLSVALAAWYAEWKGEPTPPPPPLPELVRSPRERLSARRDSAQRRRHLFGAGGGDDTGGTYKTV